MQQLISTDGVQQILERGLLGGLWSIDQFNRDSRPGEAFLPRPGFLIEHPEFYDKAFRDMQAFRRGAGRVCLF